MMNYKKPTKNELVNLLENNSQLALSKKLKVPRKTIKKWMDEYDIDSDYFKGVTNAHIKHALKTGSSPRTIAQANNVSVKLVLDRIKRHNITVPMWDIPWQQMQGYCQTLMEEFRGSQSGIKQLKYGDPNLFQNIINHTENHTLTTNKFTERIYRLAYDISPDEIYSCTECNTPLKFYTLALGYGNSIKMVCKEHAHLFMKHGSLISNEMFERVYTKLNRTKGIYFKTLNHEFRVVTRNRILIKKYGDLLNKETYYLDFYDSVQKKNIEFDGTYWHHKTKDKDQIRDKFLQEERGIQILRISDDEYKNDPEGTVQKCLEFLKA